MGSIGDHKTNSSTANRLVRWSWAGPSPSWLQLDGGSQWCHMTSQGAWTADEITEICSGETIKEPKILRRTWLIYQGLLKMSSITPKNTEAGSEVDAMEPGKNGFLSPLSY